MCSNHMTGEEKHIENEFYGNNGQGSIYLWNKTTQVCGFICSPLLLASLLLMVPNEPFKQVREDGQWKVPIRPTLIWDSIFDNNIGLLSTLN